MNRLNAEKKASPTAILLDPDGAVGNCMARRPPRMFIIDPKGSLVYQGAIDDIRSTNPDDAAKAGNYVSAALMKRWRANP